MINCGCTSNDRMTKYLKEHKNCAYLKLMSLYKKKVHRLAFSIVHDEAESEDITQDVFIKVFEKINDLREAKALSSWIYRVTVNLSLAKLRGNHPGMISFEDGLKIDQPPLLDYGSRKVANPEKIFSTKEKEEILEKAINEIPLEYKKVLVLKAVKGLSLKEISSLLGLTIPATKTRLHRGREYLKKRLNCHSLNNCKERGIL